MLYLEVGLEQNWAFTHIEGGLKFRWLLKHFWRILDHLIIFLSFSFEQNINVLDGEIELNFLVNLRSASVLVNIFQERLYLQLTESSLFRVFFLSKFHFFDISSYFDDCVLDIVLEDLCFLFEFVFKEQVLFFGLVLGEELLVVLDEDFVVFCFGDPLVVYLVHFLVFLLHFLEFLFKFISLFSQIPFFEHCVFELL